MQDFPGGVVVQIYNFAHKSFLWVVLALVLLLAVFGHGPGPGLGPDGPGGQ